MPSLRDKLAEIISGLIPENDDNLKFCGNEGKYENNGFYEMMNKVMSAITEKINSED